jgi:DNA uptake protein ComE-like DNA-binding protein
MKKGLVITAAVFFVAVAVFVTPAACQEGPGSAGVININTATEDQLRMLPLINAQLAHDIILYKFNNGPFFSLDELLNVQGMTQEKLDELRPWLVTEGETTFSPDLYERGLPGPAY